MKDDWKCCVCGCRGVIEEKRTSTRHWCNKCGTKDIKAKEDGASERRLQRIRTIAQGASAKHDAAALFARLLAVSLEADGVESESGAYL